MRELLSSSRRHYCELQIGAMSTAVENFQSYTEFVPEVLFDVRHHVRFGRRGQA